MCYSCSPICENCQPKFVFCPVCGKRGYLAFDDCWSCGHAFSQEERESAVAAWEERRARKAAAHEEKLKG